VKPDPYRVCCAGRVIHIDFGFIFDISPGRDMKFERAAFKLTREVVPAALVRRRFSLCSRGAARVLQMVDVMGGETGSLYQWFISLVVRGASSPDATLFSILPPPHARNAPPVCAGFLAVREHMDAFLYLSAAMTESDLRCFKVLSRPRARARAR
jgi:hypothetical protein